VDSAGAVLYRRNPPTQPQRIIASHVNRDLVQMLYGVVTSGTGRSALLDGHEAAGKTGTTQDYHDAWFVGFTADYVTSVWVGNDDSSPMRGVTGGTLPATIWHAVMTSAEKDLPATPLEKSSPQAPVETGIFASAPDEVTSTSDDEALGARQQENAKAHSSSGGRQTFWNWLFGGGDSGDNSGGGSPPEDEAPPDRGQQGDSGDN
jgi:penicillin-binding protein 1A